MPEIEMYFDMQPHYDGLNNRNVRTGINAMCAERYRDRKSKFKRDWFDRRGGGPSDPESLRRSPPPNMTDEEWSLHIDYYISDAVISRSAANTNVRAQQVHQSLHGRTAYAQYRHMNRDPVTDGLPSTFDSYAQFHSRNGVFTHEFLAENYRRMLDLRAAQVGSENPLSEREIIINVLGERPGHIRGMGRVISSTSGSTPSSSTSETSQRVYTQAEVDAMLATQQSQYQTMQTQYQTMQNQYQTMQNQYQTIVEALSNSGLVNINLPSTSTQFPPSTNLARDEYRTDSNDS